ncbi:MAG: substrate-binding periplasmic protein [Elstera sp.]
MGAPDRAGRHRFAKLWAYGVLWGLSGAALAQAPLPVPVQLSTGDDYPPFSAKTEPDGGAATSLVKAVFAELKLPMVLEVEPWTRGRTRTLEGQIDGTFPYVPTPERLEQFRYSRPLASIKIRLFVRQGTPLATLPLALVNGQTLCIARGTAPAAPSRRLLENKQATHVEGSDVATCLKLLLARRVDIVQTHEQIAYRTLRQFEVSVDGIQPIGGDDPRSFEETGLHLIVSRSLPHGAELIDAFDKGLATLRENGRFAEILSRYGLSLPSS